MRRLAPWHMYVAHILDFARVVVGLDENQFGVGQPSIHIFSPTTFTHGRSCRLCTCSCEGSSAERARNAVQKTNFLVPALGGSDGQWHHPLNRRLAHRSQYYTLIIMLSCEKKNKLRHLRAAAAATATTPGLAPRAETHACMHHQPPAAASHTVVAPRWTAAPRQDTHRCHAMQCHAMQCHALR